MKYLKLFENIEVMSSDEQEIMEIFQEIKDLGFDILLNIDSDIVINDKGVKEPYSYEIRISPPEKSAFGLDKSGDEPNNIYIGTNGSQSATLDVDILLKRISNISDNIHGFLGNIKLCIDRIASIGYTIHYVKLDTSFESDSYISLTWKN